MKTMNKLFNPILADVEYYFGFLFDKGYRISQVDIPFLATRRWTVLFESSECVIKIFEDQGTIFLVFAPLKQRIDDRIGLEVMIYYISQGQKYIGEFEGNHRDWKKQLERLAKFLVEYLEQITPYFEINKFQQSYSEFLAAQKEYEKLFMKKRFSGLS